ncbi:hypothetical protein BGX30_010057 [Mortierella sp. GBA39]|nr:hypothetical protein BGX30_010057 [Mortierella sp. GBA39]
MKIKILGPVLLLTLATQFARAAESAEGDNNNINNNVITDANLAAVPDAAAPAAEQVVTLNSQEAGEALEVAVDELVEAAAKAFEQDKEGEDEDDEDMDTVDADDEEDGNDEDEDKDKEGDEDGDGDDDLTEDEDQEQDEALLLEGDDFHYADPLTATYDAQTAKCKQPQQHQEQQEQEKQTKTIQKRDQTPLFPQIDEHTLSALATAEIGGACIDSFVNFALRFRERCSIKCLKTFSHVFSNPDVLGILDCFGCSNFFVSGFYALGVDCAGIFAAYPKLANSTTTPTPTGTAKGGATSTTVVSTKADAGGDYRLGQVKPEDSALPPIDFSTMLMSLGQISSGDIQDWANIGSDLAKVISGGNSGKSEGEEGSGGNGEVDEERATASKNLFNQFVSKAASFANWTLTPEMLDQTGVFDRVQQSLGL